MKTGTRLKSQVCDGEVIVVRAEGTDVPPEAGGLPMVDPSSAAEAATRDVAPGDGFLLGKRYEYVDEVDGVHIELLVTKAGASTLTWGGVPLAVQVSRPLPSSD